MFYNPSQKETVDATSVFVSEWQMAMKLITNAIIMSPQIAVEFNRDPIGSLKKFGIMAKDKKYETTLDAHIKNTVLEQDKKFSSAWTGAAINSGVSTGVQVGVISGVVTVASFRGESQKVELPEIMFSVNLEKTRKTFAQVSNPLRNVSIEDSVEINQDSPGMKKN